ncbi:NTP/NDP exchange transporter [Marinicella sp. W31]|uniref:NTP/NDP exchange transporter n=1 Tax=Marinicella sp. W31 TaxID=3023713 RepID=UPI00375642C1
MSSQIRQKKYALTQLFDIRPHELKATVAAFTLVFILMASYFVLRPVRDAMASDWSDAEVSMLWNLQFFISLGIVSLYGLLISKIRFKRVVPLVYGCFALSFMAFYVVTQFLAEVRLAEKAFYVWVSAFSLFNLSVFWSFMSDTFSKEQGKRLFAVISMGASLGAIVGPSIPVLFAEKLGLNLLMLMASVGLLLSIPLIFYIYRLKTKVLDNHDVHFDKKVLNKQWWSGFRSLAKNPYLMGIALFILLYVFIGSFVYFQQKNILAEFSRTERAEILGGIDWIVNVLTFLMAFFVTGRLLQKCGMAFTLSLLPVLLIAGMLILAFAPVVLVLLAVQISRRVGNYAVTRPAREMLFTQVSTDERFKSKPVIDVVVYRGGDAVSGSLFAVLSEGVGLGLAMISLIGAGIASLWAWLAVHLGRRYENKEDRKKTSAAMELTT